MTEPAGPAPSADDTVRPEVLALLQAASDERGFVPFDRFMEIALYGEGVGFYTRAKSPFGTEGDYYTAAHATPLFGAAIAERFRGVGRATPRTSPFRVLELGPGDGTLGSTVISRLASDADLKDRLEYILVDRSPTLAQRAYDRIRAVGETVGVPVRVAASVGAQGPFHGVVLANELLDAQPTRRLVWDGRRWLEMGIRITSEGIGRTTVPCTRVVPAPDLPAGLPEGTVVEFSPVAEAIVREVADHLASGLFLVLDYGMDERELVTAHPSGTLAGVRRHRFVDDPVAIPGSSDLSVFVNFTRVRAAAAAAGWMELSYRRQAEALGEWGFPRLFEAAIRAAPSAESEVRIRLSAKNLLFGFERFQVLELAPSGTLAGAAVTGPT